MVGIVGNIFSPLIFNAFILCWIKVNFSLQLLLFPGTDEGKEENKKMKQKTASSGSRGKVCLSMKFFWWTQNRSVEFKHSLDGCGSV